MSNMLEWRKGRSSPVDGLERDLSRSSTSQLLLLLKFFTANFDRDSEADLRLLLKRLVNVWLLVLVELYEP